MLYYDDFVMSNPITNKIRKYKIGAFYFLLGNLEPKYRAQLPLMPLVLLCKAEHSKEILCRYHASTTYSGP